MGEVRAWRPWPYTTPKCDCSLFQSESWHCTEGAERRDQGYREDTIPNRENSMGVTFQETAGRLLRECFYSPASQSYLSALLLRDITRANISCRGKQGKLSHFLRFVGNVWSTCLLILSRILLFHLESGFPDARNFSQKKSLYKYVIALHYWGAQYVILDCRSWKWCHRENKLVCIL